MKIRKVYTAIEETKIEGQKELNRPIKMIICMLVLKNPWIERGFVENLMPEINDCAPKIGDILVNELLSNVDSPDDIEAFGKAAMVGVDGEIEHASALIHTLKFGDVYRDKAEGKSVLSFTNKRGSAGSSIVIPMVHKNDDSKRSHYITFESSIPDAPRADEIIVSIGASTGGRPHPRIGNRHLDKEEIGVRD